MLNLKRKCRTRKGNQIALIKAKKDNLMKIMTQMKLRIKLKEIMILVLEVEVDQLFLMHGLELFQLRMMKKSFSKLIQ